MNLKELQDRHDVSIGNAARAASVEARKSHEGLARGYAAQITADKQDEKAVQQQTKRSKA